MSHDVDQLDEAELREIVRRLDTFFGKVLNAYVNSNDPAAQHRIAQLVFEDLQVMPDSGEPLPDIELLRGCRNLICGPCYVATAQEELLDLLNTYGLPTSPTVKHG